MNVYINDVIADVEDIKTLLKHLEQGKQKIVEISNNFTNIFIYTAE